MVNNNEMRSATMKISIKQLGISKHITVRKLTSYQAQMARIEEKFRQANAKYQDVKKRETIDTQIMSFIPVRNNQAIGNFPTGYDEASYGC